MHRLMLLRVELSSEYNEPDQILKFYEIGASRDLKLVFQGLAEIHLPFRREQSGELADLFERRRSIVMSGACKGRLSMEQVGDEYELIGYGDEPSDWDRVMSVAPRRRP